ncbi:WD40-like Beta Propeller Repeat [Streptomyces sp. DI166]|nr:WD40-like Beta Propeller Repeat [Streptomyces sp. DI166]
MRGVAVAVLAGALVAGSTTLAGAAPRPGPERITLRSTGEQIERGSGGPRLSADGRYTAFVTSDADVVPGDTNGNSDVFVRDRRTGAVERVNVASDGTQAEGGRGSHGVRISADGRYVAFMSDATNLVHWPEPPSGGVEDVYVHDRRTGRTERVSAGVGGGTALTFDTFDMSADGRFVAFGARRMESGQNNQTLAYVVDRRTGAVERVSDRIPGDWYVPYVALSADGSRLAYVQRHPRGGRHELWHADLRTGEQKLVNQVGGEPTDGSPGYPTLSADGRYVAYSSFAEEVVPEAPDHTWETYLYDSRTGGTRWITHEGRGGVGAGLLSPDGRLIAYSVETEAGDEAVAENVHVQDLRTGRTKLVTRTLAGGPQTEGSAVPSAFARGSGLLAVYSYAPDLVPGDTNGVGDGFLFRLR